MQWQLFYIIIIIIFIMCVQGLIHAGDIEGIDVGQRKSIQFGSPS